MRDKRRERGGRLGPHGDRAGGRPRGLAARIVARRLALELNQDEAAAQLGVARSTWAAWELGRAPRGLYLVALRNWLSTEEA